MDVVVAGGHGQVGLRLLALLAARGDRARGLIRDPGQAADLEAVGAEAVVCDLEGDGDVSAGVAGADAVVFAAGAGPGSGAERKQTVDLGAAVKLMSAGVDRYVIVSSVGAEDPAAGPESMRPYLEAKAEADEALAASGLDYTICRPGPLTNEPGRGAVTATPEPIRAEVTRDDVAATLVAVLDSPNTVGKTFYLAGGDVPIDLAVREL